jgi:hypothetical protein
MTTIADFGKGLGLGIAIVLPAVALGLAFARQDLFAFGYMREACLIILWLVGIAMVFRFRTIKVTKSGVELSLEDGAVRPHEAVQRPDNGAIQ